MPFISIHIKSSRRYFCRHGDLLAVSFHFTQQHFHRSNKEDIYNTQQYREPGYPEKLGQCEENTLLFRSLEYQMHLEFLVHCKWSRRFYFILTVHTIYTFIGLSEQGLNLWPLCCEHNALINWATVISMIHLLLALCLEQPQTWVMAYCTKEMPSYCTTISFPTPSLCENLWDCMDRRQYTIRNRMDILWNQTHSARHNG